MKTQRCYYFMSLLKSFIYQFRLFIQSMKTKLKCCRGYSVHTLCLQHVWIKMTLKLIWKPTPDSNSVTSQRDDSQHKPLSRASQRRAALSHFLEVIVSAEPQKADWVKSLLSPDINLKYNVEFKVFLELLFWPARHSSGLPLTTPGQHIWTSST